MYKEETSKCKSFSTHACNNCKTFELYCKHHGGVHCMDTNHEIIPIKKVGFRFFKHHVKSCISNIAKNTNSVIDQLRRTSLNAIRQLKQVNKNIKNINELKLHFYDPQRISFLVEQASHISLKMNEIDTQMSNQALPQPNPQKSPAQLNFATLQAPPQSNPSTFQAPPLPNPSSLQATPQSNPSGGQGTN